MLKKHMHQGQVRKQSLLQGSVFCLMLAFSLFTSAITFGQGADVIVGELPSTAEYGQNGGIYAYAVGTTSCNLGDVPLEWIAGNNRHPVIGQNLYRLKNDRFEQVGMSWLKHGFTALQGTVCGPCNAFPNGTALGVGCSDPYGAGLNGNQSGLGPRSEINASTGVYPYPQILNPPINDNITRRLQVHAADIDPAQNAGAQYFIEGHYVAFDDAQAGNHHNNASYRRVTVSNNAQFSLNTTGQTFREEEAINAWAAADPTVTLSTVIVDAGKFVLGTKVTDLGNGFWQYEYALYNMNSDRSAGSFTLPTGTGLVTQNVGFHDVDYHSTEPYSGADWTPTIGASSISWETESFASNPNANALRWSSLYNFRFQSNAAPVSTLATIGLFKPGAQADTVIQTFAPASGGGSTMPITALNCAATDSDIDLSWTNGETYDSVLVFRDGIHIDTLAGSSTSYQDAGLAIGTYDYTLNGVTNNTPSQGATCSSEVLPPQPASNLVCAENGFNIELSWDNNAPYDSIQLRRNGFIIANLPGTATSYTDVGLSVDSYDYRWSAISNGISVDFVFCVGTISAPPAHVFTLSAPSMSVGYNAAGNASFDVSLGLVEDSTSPGFPNDVAGLSFGLAHDETYLTATNITYSSDLDALNGGMGPDFFSGFVVPGGVTYGIIFDFFQSEFVQYNTAADVAVVSYETNAANVQGAGAVDVALNFENETLGNPPVESTVVVGNFSSLPMSDNGTISLFENGGAQTFTRSDVNGDGSLNLVDVVTTLGFLFSGGTVDCQKAMDFNDDGALNLVDPIGMLAYQFSGGADPAAPFPGCGNDPTADSLSCDGPVTSCP